MNTSENPIFVEYYSHENCDCYKVKNPWTKYACETLVLCKVSDGIEIATAIATKILIQKMFDAFSQPAQT